MDSCNSDFAITVVSDIVVSFEVGYISVPGGVRIQDPDPTGYINLRNNFLRSGARSSGSSNRSGYVDSSLRHHRVYSRRNRWRGRARRLDGQRSRVGLRDDLPSQIPHQRIRDTITKSRETSIVCPHGFAVVRRWPESAHGWTSDTAEVQKSFQCTSGPTNIHDIASAQMNSHPWACHNGCRTCQT